MVRLIDTLDVRLSEKTTQAVAEYLGPKKRIGSTGAAAEDERDDMGRTGRHRELKKRVAI